MPEIVICTLRPEGWGGGATPCSKVGRSISGPGDSCAHRSLLGFKVRSMGCTLVTKGKNGTNRLKKWVGARTRRGLAG